MDLEEKLPTLDFISSSYFLPIFKALADAKRAISVVQVQKEDSMLLDSHLDLLNSGLRDLNLPGSFCKFAQFVLL